LKAATASSRAETLPMFVRSHPSRTRAERPIPGDRVLDALTALQSARTAAALALVAAYLSRAGTVEANESGRTLGILAVTAAEANPTEGDILGAWAGIILDSADGSGLARCKPSGGAAGSRG
jgi:hypothetical protein